MSIIRTKNRRRFLMQFLELFCGMGGWSIGFHREGFDCVGLDTTDVGYPYDLALCDIRNYNPGFISPSVHLVDFKPQVIGASPPCTEFSVLTRLSYQKGYRSKPDPDKGLELVREGLRVIHKIDPLFWFVENVFGSVQYISPILGKPRIIAKPWVLWGNFPDFFLGNVPKGEKKISHNYEKPREHGTRPPDDFPFNPLRSWQRARIPIWLAGSMAKKIKEELTEKLLA
jgi:C-5 cytosine-specific DNA methylase